MSTTNPTPREATCPHAATIGERYSPLVGERFPLDFYAEARRAAPVCYSPRHDVWFVTGYSEIQSILKDPQRFSSTRHWIPVPLPPEVEEVLAGGYRITNTFTSDPPAHTRLRSLVGAAFTAHRTAAMEPKLRAVAHRLVDRFAHAGRTDLMASFAYPLCLSAVGDLLGLPHEDHDALKRWQDDYVMLTLSKGTLDQQLAWARGHVAHQRYFASLVEERRVRPGDDLLSLLAQARFDGEPPLSTDAIVGEALSLQIAGSSAPVQTIAFLFQWLLGDPERTRAVAADPRLAEAAVDEIVRTLLVGYSRTATEAVEIGGVTIPKGARVYLVIAAANHDDDFIDHADRVDVHRANPSRHLGFGWGVHYCMGAPLARLEGRIAIEVLRERLPNLRIAPGFAPEFVPTTAFRKIKECPIAWDPR